MSFQTIAIIFLVFFATCIKYDNVTDVKADGYVVLFHGANKNECIPTCKYKENITIYEYTEIQNIILALDINDTAFST